MNLKDNLRKIRKDNNLSQEDLAEKLGVSRQSVSKWEQGLAYPEMDKVLQMCNMFNLNIDEFLNQDIKKVEKNKESKININKYIDEFLSFVTKTISMFSAMSFKEKFKCLLEQFVIFFILCIAGVVISGVFDSVLTNILEFLPSKYYISLLHMFNGVFYLIFVAFGIMLMIHVFKVRYLDYYEVVDNNEEENDNTKEEQTEEVKTNKKEEMEFKKPEEKKIIIRDPNHSSFKFIRAIMKGILFFIKLFVISSAVPFCFSMIGLFAAFLISFVFIKTGLFFVGCLLGIIACILVNFLLLYIAYFFVVNKKMSLMFIFVVFISALVLAGLSVGTLLISIKDFEYVDDESDALTTKEIVYNMSDNLVILNDYDYHINYIKSDNNDVKVEYKYADVCEVKTLQNDNIVSIDLDCNELDSFKNIIKNFQNKKVVNPTIIKVNVYTNSSNIEKLKTNENNYYIEMNQSSYNEEIDRLNDIIEEKDDEIERLRERLGE